MLAAGFYSARRSSITEETCNSFASVWENILNIIVPGNERKSDVIAQSVWGVKLLASVDISTCAPWITLN
jgi:hypothetical protein